MLNQNLFCCGHTNGSNIAWVVTWNLHFLLLSHSFCPKDPPFPWALRQVTACEPQWVCLYSQLTVPNLWDLRGHYMRWCIQHLVHTLSTVWFHSRDHSCLVSSDASNPNLTFKVSRNCWTLAELRDPLSLPPKYWDYRDLGIYAFSSRHGLPVSHVSDPLSSLEQHGFFLLCSPGRFEDLQVAYHGVFLSNSSKNVLELQKQIF